MSIPTIITPMNMTLVRDAICQHIVNIRESQKELAIASGADDNWVLQNLNFVVFPKRFRFPNAEELPCVYVYFNEGDFPEDEQDIYENQLVGKLQVEYYAGGINEFDEEEEADEQVIATADANAEDRLQYLTAQLYKTLCSEETNVYQATNNLVNSFKPRKWKRILTPKEANSTESVLGAKLEFDVGINEPTYYKNTTLIKEFYTTLKIQDEFIDPLAKIILAES